MRGRLIQKFMVSIARLDEAASAAVVGGGYDDDFKEFVPVPDGTQTGTSSKVYHDPVIVCCQLDRDEAWGRVQSTRGGQEHKSDLVIVLHMPELEKKGLIDSNGHAVFMRGDKVIEVLTMKGGLVERFRDPPGMFITHMDTAGYGLEAFGTARQNLLFVYADYDKKGGTE